MVGVPHSKGCKTCLRRRVKCNEERPICGQCKKTGYQCLGYEKERTFHNQTVKPGVIEAAVLQHVKPSSQETTADELVVLASQFLEISCPREIDLSAFEDKFMLTCLFTNYVHSNFGSPWLELSAQGKLGITSRTASLAVASEFFAQYHDQPKFKIPAVELYGTSLRLMRKELAGKENSCVEKYTIPIMIMIAYDFLTWQSGLSCDHFYGLSRVIELCEPTRFQIEPYHSAFESAREILDYKQIMMNLQIRKRSFFEQKRWKTIPWDLETTKKSPANQLIDFLADIPGLLADETAASISERAADTEALRDRVLEQLGRLYNWRWTWEARNLKAVSEIPVLLEHKEGEMLASSLFKPELQYSSYVRANEIGLYNSIQMLLLRLLLDNGGLDSPEVDRLCSKHLELALSHREQGGDFLLMLPGEVRSLSQPAVEILRSFSFQLGMFYKHRDSMLAWVLPMGLAQQVFRHDDGDAACLARGKELLANAPVSFRQTCLYIAQSIDLYRRS